MTEVTIAQLEEQRDHNKRIAEQGEAHDRLMKNRDFRKIILEGFMVEQAARYVQESADPALTDRQRADALGIAQASGHLKRYLQIQRLIQDQAADRVVACDAAIEEMRQEGAE